MIKQPDAMGKPLVEKNSTTSETIMVKIHEVGRHIVQGQLNPKPEYDKSELFRFKWSRLNSQTKFNASIVAMGKHYANFDTD